MVQVHAQQTAHKRTRYEITERQLPVSYESSKQLLHGWIQTAQDSTLPQQENVRRA